MELTNSYLAGTITYRPLISAAARRSHSGDEATSEFPDLVFSHVPSEDVNGN